MKRIQALVLMLGIAATAAAQSTGTPKTGTPKSDPAVGGLTLLDRLRAAGQKPGAKKQDEKDSKKTGGIADLLAPKGAKPADAKKPRSIADLLQLRSGRAGNSLRGLREDPRDMTPGANALIGLLNTPAARHREAGLGGPPNDDSYFPELSTLGIPSWSERPTRDGQGRLTRMSDANGNSVRFRYDANGFRGIDTLPRGPLNPDFTPQGTTKAHPGLGRFTERPDALGNPEGWDNRFTYENNRFRFPSSPFTGRTESRIESNGKRSFLTHDTFGRPVTSWSSDGKLTLNRYGPNGGLVGTYDSTGRLLMLGQDGTGRHHSAYMKGARALVQQSGIGGIYLRGQSGSQLNSLNGFHGLRPAPSALTTPTAPTNLNPGAPNRPAVPQRR